MAPLPNIATRVPSREIGAADCRQCPVRAACVLEKLRVRTAPAAAGILRHSYKSRQYLFCEGDPCDTVAVLARGRVQIRRCDAEQALLYVDWRSPGRLLDYRAVLPRALHRASARAEGAVDVCTAPNTDVARAIAGRGDLMLGVLGEAERENRQLEQAIRLRAARPLEMRVRLALQMITQSYGRRGEGDAWQVDLPIHRRDLASLVGARPETISRILHDIEAKGLAHFAGRHVDIPHLAELACAAPTLLAERAQT